MSKRESEVKKCPKCGGEMEIGFLRNAIYWMRGRSRLMTETGERAFAHKCRNCGYVEIYVEKEKEKASYV